MANCVFSWQNWIDDAFASVQAGSQVSTLPIANIVDTRVQKIWRSDGTLTDYIVCDFGQLRTVRLIGLFGANITGNDTVRYRLANTEGGLTGSPVYDSGVLASNATVGSPQHMIVLGSDVIARWIRIDIAAPSAIATGAIDVGRVWAGQIDFQPTYNYAPGAELNVRSLSRVTISPASGATFVDKRRKLKSMSIELKFVTEDEINNQVSTLDTIVGFDTQLVFLPDPDDAVIAQKAVCGYLRGIGATRYIIPGLYSKAFSIEEAG